VSVESIGDPCNVCGPQMTDSTPVKQRLRDVLSYITVLLPLFTFSDCWHGSTNTTELTNNKVRQTEPEKLKIEKA